MDGIVSKFPGNNHDREEEGEELVGTVFHTLSTPGDLPPRVLIFGNICTPAYGRSLPPVHN